MVILDPFRLKTWGTRATAETLLIHVVGLPPCHAATTLGTLGTLEPIVAT